MPGVGARVLRSCSTRLEEASANPELRLAEDDDDDNAIGNGFDGHNSFVLVVAGCSLSKTDFKLDMLVVGFSLSAADFKLDILALDLILEAAVDLNKVLFLL